MNPLSIRGKNYRTFERFELTLPEGCVAILGVNGAGKSSLANVPDLCLFGPDGRSWAPYLTQGGESTELELEVTFEHGGAKYRARRGYSARGAGKTTFDLERWKVTPDHSGDDEGPGWTPLTRESMPSTQAHVEELLGMTRETFRASSMLVQGDGAAFTEAKPAERKRILSKILGLERFEVWLDLCRRERRTVENTIERLAGELAAADRELLAEDGSERIPVGEAAVGSMRTAIADNATRLEAARAELEAAALAVSAGEELRRRHAEALTVAAEARAKVAPLDQLEQTATAAAGELATLKDEIERLKPVDTEALDRRKAELEGTIEAYRRAVITREETQRTRELKIAERDAILAQAAAKAEEARSIDDQVKHLTAGELDSCPTCRQNLGEQARADTIASLRAKAQTAEDQGTAIRERAEAIALPEIPAEPEPLVDVESELAEVRAQITKAHEDELSKARLDGHVAALTEKINARPAATEILAARQEAEHAQAEAERIAPPDESAVAEVRARALTAKARVDELERSAGTASQELARAETLLERLRDVAARTIDARAERTKLQAVVDDLAILEASYKPDGLPSQIIQRVAIPSIEREANRILGELGGKTASCRIELRTERAKADGGIADALDVVVVTPDGERPYETFSGGERTRLNLSLRIALARLLAHRRGAESRFLVIDEPEYLDQVGTAALVAVLRGLSSDFDRVYLISHVGELRDSLDTTIEVVQDADGLSRIAA